MAHTRPRIYVPGILLTGLLFCPLLLTGQSQKKTVHLEDHSDWWSVLNESFQPPHSKRLDKDLPSENFEVMGVHLDYEPSFKSVESKFGQAVIVERGDGANGRDQICYSSAQRPDTHLIFEKGELNLVFYLIAGGKRWNGDNFCAKSAAVTSDVSTTSGLHLGMTRADLEQILGKPDFSANDKLIYFQELKKETSPTELAELRTKHPEMSAKDFHETYDFSNLNIYIEARFVGSKLTYLAASKAETD
ncbi:MAG TPA: hypothetical protein VHQ22_00985 [Terriglobales bacterium]|jgi:hypothetical protein|nr:hypothetical protein [Terriglobales bacterium]